MVKYIEKNKKGMMLVETITSLAILSIILLLLCTLIIITIRKENYYEKEIRTYIYINSAINFIENQLDKSITEFSIDNNALILKNKNDTLIDVITLKNNSIDIESNKKVKKPEFKIDRLDFKKCGTLLYVTVEIQGEKLTRCLELKSQDIKREIFQ